MPDRPLTLMAVHAHPDDEATSTGGVLARYSAEGVRTVLVTCTDGACGDGPGGVKPGEPGHDRQAVVALRAKELEASCIILGVNHLELLEYRDSGMMGWSQNEEAGSFWTAPVDEAADRLAALMEHYRPDVVVTYDPNGFYGHPDHIQAHRITMVAAEKTGIPAKVYWTTIPRSRMGEFRQRMRDAGVDMPDAEPSDAEPSAAEPEGGEVNAEQGPPMGSPDEDIAAWVDVSTFADRKYDALAAHASQGDNIFFLRMGRKVFAELMGGEVFLRAVDRTGAPLPEDDLFAGLR
ncbi:MAG: PIG-L family deacetylase [Actinomycetota bacterium]|nr:PIG-L family deacetylase [Actinomycetota bacterium]